MVRRTLLDWLFLEQELVEDLKELESSIENNNIAREVEGRELITSTEPYRKIIKNLGETLKVILIYDKKPWPDHRELSKICENFDNYTKKQVDSIINERTDFMSYKLDYESIMNGEMDNFEMPDSPLFEETLWTSREAQAFFPNLYEQLKEMINRVKPESRLVPAAVIGYIGKQGEDEYDWPFLNLFLKDFGDETTTDLNKYLSLKTKQWLMGHIAKEHEHNWMYYYLPRSEKKIYMREAIEYETGIWKDPDSDDY